MNTPASLDSLVATLQQTYLEVCAVRADLATIIEHMERTAVAMEQMRSDLRVAVNSPHFTCPRCSNTTFSPRDIIEGYCGWCHDWTRPT